MSAVADQRHGVVGIVNATLDRVGEMQKLLLFIQEPYVEYLGVEDFVDLLTDDGIDSLGFQS